MAVVIPEAITKHGWELYEKCHCGGVKLWKFRHPMFPTYELHWQVSYFNFKIMNGNSTKIPLTKILLAEDILKSLT